MCVYVCVSVCVSECVLDVCVSVCMLDVCVSECMLDVCVSVCMRGCESNCVFQFVCVEGKVDLEECKQKLEMSEIRYFK